MEVKDVTGISLKSYELFSSKEFNYLFKGDYIPAAIKEELRQEALAQGLIGGNMRDYSGSTKQEGSGGRICINRNKD